MEALIAALNSAKSADEIETALSSSNVNDSEFAQNSGDSTTVKDDLKAVLERVLENEAILTTAKLRRRVKRFQQSLDVVQAAPETAEPAHYAPVEIKQHSSPEESIAALTTCRSYFDLAREMNNLCLPGDQEGGVNSEVFSKYRIPMKDILKRLVDTKGMTNKILRRRVNRLIFVLSTEAEQAEELAAVKAKAAMAAVRNLTAKKVRPAFTDNKREFSEHSSSLPAAASETPVAAPVLSKFEAARYIADCISGIRSAKVPADVERVINALPSGGFGDSETLRDLLNSIIENAELVNNAKLRRRVKRLIDTLMSSNVAAAAAEAEAEVVGSVVAESDSNAYVPSSSSKYDKKVVEASRQIAAPKWEKEKALPLHIPSTDSAVVVPVAPPVRVITGSFTGSLKLLEVAASTAQVEEAISDLCADSEGDDGVRDAVRVRLELLFADESVVNNSKLRRRVKRLIDILAPPSVPEESAPEVNDVHAAPSAAATAKKAKKKKKAPTKKEDLKNPPSGPSLDGIIAEASSARTSDALTSALSAVTGESGSCATRRTLKRILERVMKDDSCLSGQMTAQNRRKLRRVADILSPRPAAIHSIVPPIAQATT